MERVTDFPASLKRITTHGKDGDSQVTFEVPLSHMPAVARLYLVVGELIHLTVERAPK